MVHAKQALASLEAIRAEAHGIRGALSGRLRIGSIPSATVNLSPKAMAQFARRHPAVELVLLEEPSQGMRQLLEWLGSATIDIALLETPIGAVEVAPLIRDEMCAIVSSRSPLARHKQVSVLELTKEPFIMSRYSSERLIRAAYARENIAPAVRFEVQDLGTLVGMVREGLGISIVPKVAFPTAPPGVSLIPILPRIRRQLGHEVSPPRRPSPTGEAFIEALREVSGTARATAGTSLP
jgi:DNA-binding transcriptional LysR family regulator